MHCGFRRGQHGAAGFDELRLSKSAGPQLRVYRQGDAGAWKPCLIIDTRAQQSDLARQPSARRQCHRGGIADGQRSHGCFRNFGVQFDQIVARNGEQHRARCGRLARPRGSLEHTARHGRSDDQPALAGQQVVKLRLRHAHGGLRRSCGDAPLVDRLLRQHALIVEPRHPARVHASPLIGDLLLAQLRARLIDLRTQQRIVQHRQYLSRAYPGVFFHQHARDAIARKLRRDRNFLARDQSARGAKASCQRPMIDHGHRHGRRRWLLRRFLAPTAGSKQQDEGKRHGKGMRLEGHGISLDWIGRATGGCSGAVAGSSGLHPPPKARKAPTALPSACVRALVRARRAARHVCSDWISVVRSISPAR